MTRMSTIRRFSKHCRKNSAGKHEKQYLILEHRGRNRSQIKEEMRENSLQSGRRKFVERYWDARVFGNTFLEEGENNFIRTGVVQFGMGISLAPVEIIRQTNTNKAGVESGKDRGMAPMAYRIVDHRGILHAVFVNPNQAEKKAAARRMILNCSKLLIPHAYEQNRSAIRPDVRIRHAWYIEHKSILGKLPGASAAGGADPVKLGNPDEPSTSWTDYQDKTGLPEDLLARVESCTDLILRG